MNKNCGFEEKARSDAFQDENFKRHAAECAECRETAKVAEWMQRFAAQTSTAQNLRSPGFLLLKARVIEKENQARRAAQPIFWMQIAALLLIIVGAVFLEIKSETPVLSIFGASFAAVLSTSLPVFLLGALCAALICFAFAYKIRGTKS